jgi:hypothetical protein
MKYAEMIARVRADGRFLGDEIGKCLRTASWTAGNSPGIDRLFKKSLTWAAFQGGDDLSLRFDPTKTRRAFLIWRKGERDPEPSLPIGMIVDPEPGTARAGYMLSEPFPVEVDLDSGLLRDLRAPQRFAVCSDVEECLYQEVESGRYCSFKPVADTQASVPRLHVSAIRFRERFDQFKATIKDASGEPFCSFSEGLPFREEGYKERLHEEGRNRLRIQEWDEDWIDTGQILDCVIQAIEIDDSSVKLRNNLVHWKPKFGPDSKSHQPLLLVREDPSRLKKTEQALFNLFQEAVDDDEAFGALFNLGLRRYDVLSYLYFLRDWEAFAPVSPSKFDDAFKMLDIPLKTSKQSSWENYTQFNAVLREVQQLLVGVGGVESVRLIDAHTFCWMLSGLKIPEPETSSRITTPVLVSLAAPGSAEKTTPVAGASERRIDYEAVDKNRRRVGHLAEEIAFQSEKCRLVHEGHPQLSEAGVSIVSDDSTLGYDILSCEIDGSPRHIEVKAVRKRDDEIQFFLTENERKKSQKIENYWFYFVTAVDSQSPIVHAIRADDSKRMKLEPIVYRASARIV